MGSSYWPIHAHSSFSQLDGMGTVLDMVHTVVENDQPALALTDHGNLAGAVQLYRHCSRAGLAAYPGSELYLVRSLDRGELPDGTKYDDRKRRYHIGVLALDLEGWRALVKLSSLSHQRDHFHQKPLVTLPEFLEWGQANGRHVAVTTGCFFGWVVQHHLEWGRDTERTKALVSLFSDSFPHLFVELQNHGVEHDDHTDADIIADLLEVAYDLSLPVLAGQDSHYCTEMSEPLLMADLSYKPIGEVVVGDKVLGWHRPDGKSNKVATAATVTHVMHREAEAVKMTFESGATVVCTPDHNWMQYGPWKAGIDRWGPLGVGSEAVRITMPRQTPEGMERDAGWLGGMYDGEGSRQGIAQSYTANPEVCDRIEWTLTALGFNYAVQDNGAGTNVYRIKGGDESMRGPNLWIDFLNIAQPTKHQWITDRVVDRRLRAIGADRVVSIEPVGIKTVVSLTTTTGNYISAGLASKNCDAADQHLHDTMKEIAYRGGNGEDNRFPGGPYHLASEAFMRKMHGAWWNLVAEGHEHLLDLHDLVVPELDGYRFRVPEVSKDPDAKLREMVDGAFSRHDRWGDPDYANQIERELEVIRAKQMAEYFLIVADYCTWSRGQGITINARGSANGSLVCYLLGITEVDPLVWGTSFDRFLSIDREKPPDIDLDIESDRRDDVVEYLRARFPRMTQIGTWLHLGTSGDSEEQKGSVFVQWHAAARSRGQDGEIPRDQVRSLRQLDLVDVKKGAGAHAGGFALPADGVEDLVPTMLIASSNTVVTQFDMDDVEQLGLVKVDLLGLRSLTTMRRTLELIGRDPSEGLGWIPLDDAQACRILRSGVADNGVFQFEGFSTAQGSKRLGVRSTEDAVLSLALFRPAAMNGGQSDRYLEARRASKRELIHPKVDDLFDATRGVPIWQEDVLNMMRRVGLGPADVNAILKAVKSSNERIAQAEKTFARVHPIFVQAAMDNLGATSDEAERIWATVREFSDYGFNRAHAVSYGLMAYRMAYLKAHHPTEFHAALLDTWAGTDKEPKYVREAQRMKLTVHRPDVNVSKAGWWIESEGHLRRGFRSIHGIGERAAEELEAQQPYESVEDLCERVSGRALPGSKKFLAKRTRGEVAGALAALRDAGALKSLGMTKEDS